MNIKIHYYKLLLCLALFTTSLLNADRTTGKTYFAPRTPGSQNIALAGAHKLFSNQHKKNHNAKLQLSGFYGTSNNGTDLGGSLLRKGKNNFVLWSGVGTEPTDSEDGRLYVDNNNEDTSVGADEIKITPEQQRYGVQCTYRYAFNDMQPGLYAGFNATFAQVSNTLNLAIKNPTVTAGSANNLTIADYFAGKQSTSANTTQKALLFSTMDNEKHTKTGICNAEFLLGWNAIDDADYCLKIHAAVNIPTDAKSTCKLLFEPRVGFQHWGIGAGTDIRLNLFRHKNKALNFIANIEYRYFLEEVERRTFDALSNQNFISPDFARYVLVTDLNAPANQKLRPFANDATRNFWLTPGSRIEGTAVVSYDVNNVSLQAGYNLFFKDAETGFLRDPWINDAIGFVDTGFIIANTAETQAALITAINNRVLDYNAVFSASQLTHKLFCSAGYTAPQERRIPVMINVGVGYEFADRKTTALEGFEAWGKLCVSF